MTPNTSTRIDPHARIHPTARIGEGCIIEADARIGAGVRLGPGCRVSAFAVLRGGEAGGGAELGEGCVVEEHALVGARVKMGRGNRLLHHAAVEGRTDMGEGNQVHPGAVLGGPPQDVQLPGENTGLRIGDGNVFREFVTISTGTPKENGVTVVGSRNLLMAGVHFGHDCIVEDDCIITNNCLFAGHCKVERKAVIGGAVVFPPFHTVGRFAHIGGACSMDRDLPPYMVAHGGYQARISGVNVVGLRRNGFSAEAIRALQLACQRLYIGRPAKFEAALAELERDGPHTPEVKYLCEFSRASLAGRYMRAREILRMKPAAK